MKVLVYTAIGELTIEEFPDPKPARGEVRVRVSATGICGSDIHGFLGHQARRQPGLILGHETLGIIDEVGDGVDAELVGKRVSVNPLISCGVCPPCRAGRQNVCVSWKLLGLDRTHGGFAEAVVVPQRNVHPLPDSVSDCAAVMVEPLANAFHILSMIPGSAGLLPTAVLFGAGTLGSCILTVALARGLNILAVSEPNPRRAEVARRLGAPRVFNPKDVDFAEQIRKLTDGRGVEVAIDAVGRQVTRTTAAAVTSRGGTVLLLGLDEGPTTFDFADVLRRELRLQCSYAYTESDFAAALDFVVQGRADFGPYTDIVPLEAGQQAFERLIGDPGDRLKIALTPL
jgi:2-desacetyl-2-hydroxyethyl bacteriochlorophyllide A dehydrogenase